MEKNMRENFENLERRVFDSLYNTDLEGNYIGGCVDTSCFEIKDITNYFTNGVGVDYREYINSGVILFDMKTLREKKFADKFLYLFYKYNLYFLHYL